uniref:Uncharacterized protein n=1 Tax=Romanomermis culicivorax TaxID=13658 RepID=A0A915IAD2_ROMCU
MRVGGAPLWEEPDENFGMENDTEYRCKKTILRDCISVGIRNHFVPGCADPCTKCTTNSEDQTHKTNYHGAIAAMRNDREKAE